MAALPTSRDRYRSIRKELDEKGVQLIAVSKEQPIERILELFNQDQKQFGENKVQELVRKHDLLTKDIEWHMIGHLQTNKVKYIVPFIRMIQSVDRVKLLREIDKQARKVDRIIDVLLQVHIAEETTKFGFSEAELYPLLKSGSHEEFKNVRVCGFMGMATFTDRQDQVKREFLNLKRLFDQAKAEFFPQADHFRVLSMGMSGDYQLAIECGSTMVRLGTIIFGPRS